MTSGYVGNVMAAIFADGATPPPSEHAASAAAFAPGLDFADAYRAVRAWAIKWLLKVIAVRSAPGVTCHVGLARPVHTV
jgi:hypothetical protein